jgi:hypothetical protein
VNSSRTRVSDGQLRAITNDYVIITKVFSSAAKTLSICCHVVRGSRVGKALLIGRANGHCRKGPAHKQRSSA